MRLEDILKKRVVVLDGAMGTMIQRYGFGESDYRGADFAEWPRMLKGCNDLLCLTQPDSIAEIHRQYIDAGADIIETNTFNANSVSLSEYGLEEYVGRINRAGAGIARVQAEEAYDKYGRRIFVAGSMGPGNVSLSIPENTGSGKPVTFDDMAAAYKEQAIALMEGGVDLILLETIFDTLNAKAAIAGVKDAMMESGRELPLMLSVTLTENGRTLSGQTLDAFVASTLHSGAMSIGLNCGFGAEGMEPYLKQLQKYGRYVSLHPNAGLPDEMGQYEEKPSHMAETMGRYMRKGWLNIAGGCCGTTPEHIRAIAEEAAKSAARELPTEAPDTDPETLLVSGLEAMEVSPAGGFEKVGERCNVAGSKKFLRLINEGNYPEALEIAAGQLKKGAGLLDINMDDGMLDSVREMTEFVSMLGLDGNTAPAPLMIDSSRKEVILSALKRIQGRPIVNSISLKEGEGPFLESAAEIRRLGGAAVVMAFDEKGQATTYERRIEICRRAYELLTRKCGYRGCEIIFDPNILTVATGMPEHDRYALDFLNAVSWIKENLPGAKVSGGVSNLSFAFRGNNTLREAMHTVFLHYGIERGMDMAIVNPATSLDISTVNPELREAVEDLIFCRREDAVFRLLEMATRIKREEDAQKGKKPSVEKKKPEAETDLTLGEMVEKGVTANLEEKLRDALTREGSAMGVVKNHLMEGMNRVGEAFGAGRMFLPQVVRSAGVMKQAISWLTPYMERENTSLPGGGAGKMVLATVKGDVHDIGKNIVAVVMRCAGFEVVDMGVMAEGEDIVAKARETGADFIGLSGLITPSLTEMVNVAEIMERDGMHDTALFVGGATTSELHTAVKIAPVFSGLTVHTRDAAAIPDVAAALKDASRKCKIRDSILEMQEKIRKDYAGKKRNRNLSDGKSEVKIDMEKAEKPSPAPRKYGVDTKTFTPGEVAELINWKAFYHVWKLPQEAEEERERLKADAEALIRRLDGIGVVITARYAVLEAVRRGDDIVMGNGHEQVVLPTLRRESEPRLAMSDFLAESNDWLGMFVVTVGERVGRMVREKERGDEYESLLLQSVADRLVEAATEKLHTYIHDEYWGLKGHPRGIRPAIGYPSLPDQSLVFELDGILNYGEIGVKTTANGALWPSATTTGLIFVSPEARYFEVGELSEEAISDYAGRRGLPEARVRQLLPKS